MPCFQGNSSKSRGNEQNKQWRFTSSLLFNNQLFYIPSYEATSNSKEETQKKKWWVCLRSKMNQKSMEQAQKFRLSLTGGSVWSC